MTVIRNFFAFRPYWVFWTKRISWLATLTINLPAREINYSSNNRDNIRALSKVDITGINTFKGAYNIGEFSQPFRQMEYLSNFFLLMVFSFWDWDDFTLESKLGLLTQVHLREEQRKSANQVNNSSLEIRAVYAGCCELFVMYGWVFTDILIEFP